MAFHLLCTDSPVLLSFPHFYMGDQTLRLAVDGISPPEKEKHQFFIDVQPVIISFSFINTIVQFKNHLHNFCFYAL